VAKQVFIIKYYHMVVLIPQSTTQILEPNNLNPPLPPLSQVIVNLLGGHIDPNKLRDHECNLPNMHFLETFVSFNPLPHQIMEPPKHEPRLDRSPLHRAIGLRGCRIAIIINSYPILSHHIVLSIIDNNLVKHVLHFLSTTSITLNKQVGKENKLHDQIGIKD
jgi:hypothetical protein